MFRQHGVLHLAMPASFDSLDLTRLRAASFFGFIHATQPGRAVSAQVALGYALFGAVCFAASLQGGNKSA
jgi:hypothetical protein